jgi:hypothetical protein
MADSDIANDKIAEQLNPIGSAQLREGNQDQIRVIMTDQEEQVTPK